MSSYGMGLPAHFPRGLFGWKKVLYVSMDATVYRSAARARYSQLSVKHASKSAKNAAILGLRKNLKVSNPSIGASFHAPPNAEIQPPIPPMATITSHVGRLTLRCAHVMP